MFYSTKFVMEQIEHHTQVINEYENGIGNWSDEWIENEVKPELDQYMEELRVIKNRLDKAEYTLQYMSARKFKYPVDIDIPVIINSKDEQFYIDITLLMNDMNFLDHSEKTDRKNGILFHIEEKDDMYKSVYVYEFTEEDGFYVHKHIVAHLYSAPMIAAYLFTSRIRNKKLYELLQIWYKEFSSFIKNTNIGARAFKEVFSDVKFIDAVTGEESNFISDGLLKPSPEEYFTKKQEAQNRIKEASEKERDELYNEKEDE